MKIKIGRIYILITTVLYIFLLQTNHIIADEKQKDTDDDLYFIQAKPSYFIANKVAQDDNKLL